MRNKSNIFSRLAWVVPALLMVLTAFPRLVLAAPVNTLDVVHIESSEPTQTIPMGVYALRARSGQGYLCVDDVPSKNWSLAVLDPDSDGWNIEALFFVSNWGNGVISIIHLSSGLRLTGGEVGGVLRFVETNSNLLQWWSYLPLDDGSVWLNSNEVSIGMDSGLGGIWRPRLYNATDEVCGFEFMPRSATLALPLSTGAYALDNSQPDADASCKLSLDTATSYNDQMFYIVPVDDGSHFLLTPQTRRFLLCSTGSAVVLRSTPHPLERWSFNKVGDDAYQIMLEGTSAVVGLSSKDTSELSSGMPLGLVPSTSESALSFSIAQDGVGYMQRPPLRRALTAFSLLVFSATIAPLIDRALKAHAGPRFKAVSRNSQSRAVPAAARATHTKARS